ncbi:MAG: sulfotransferase domain-containing protein [Planctomycetota bacterium]
MRLPDFLIIGAMKAGTTTLYRDLLTHPRVFFPLDKEPNNLTSERVLEDAGRSDYAALFKDARADQLCGEASTAYTKRPTFEGVPERAASLLGEGLRVVYLMREPVARVRSHHRHMRHFGECTTDDLAHAIERHPELIDYSRYAMQLEPWIDALGADRVLPLEMEAYTADRAATVARVQAFLGLDPRPDLVEADKVYNQADGKPVIAGRWRAFQQSGPYRKLIRPLLGVETRARLRAALLPKASGGDGGVGEELERAILDAVADDQRRLAALLGDRAPSWCRREP